MAMNPPHDRSSSDPPDASALLALHGFIQLRLLGSGVSGRVFACYPRTNQSNEVAVKMVALHSSSRCEEGQEEKDRSHQKTNNHVDELTILRYLGKLSLHDNIVRFHSDFRDVHYQCILMELCAGGDLDSYLRARLNNTVSERDALEILTQIYSGLEFLHSNEIIHRDLKCANILLKNSNASRGPLLCKIGDYGFARRLAPGERATTILGTPLFMAPEILMSNAYSFSADFWSLGCIFYSCLYGKRPFHGSNPRDLLKSILSRRGPSPLMNVPSLPPINPATHRVLSSLLSVRPAGRQMMRSPGSLPSVRGMSSSTSSSSYVGRMWEFASGYMPSSRSTARKRSFSEDYVVVDSALASIPEAKEITSASTTKARTTGTGRVESSGRGITARKPKWVQWRDRLRAVLILVPFGDHVVGLAITESYPRHRARLLSRAAALYLRCLWELRPTLASAHPTASTYVTAFTLFEQVLERILQCTEEASLHCPIEEGLDEVIRRILLLADAKYV